MKQILFLLAALALVGSACSTDVASASDDSASASPPEVQQEPAEPDEAEPVAATATAEPDTPADADEPEDKDEPDAASDVFDGNGSGDWCEIFRALEADEDDEPRGSAPEEIEAHYQEVAEEMVALQRVAPPEIASDFAFVVDSNFRVIDAFEAVEWKIEDLDETVFGSFEAAAYEQAIDNVETYNIEVCGIEF